MLKANGWIPKFCVASLLLSSFLQAGATVQDATILIDRALNSPTLTIRYSGAHVALIELRINGSSYGTRGIDPSIVKGETNFTIDLSSLNSGDNDVEVRLYDKDGKVVGSQKSTITTDEGSKAAIYMAAPKMGATVQGPLQLTVAFNKELKNTYVSFFIDNQFKSMTNSPPFSYLWDTTRDANGWHEVEAWAVDDTSVTYRTRRVKVFVNNPGGLTVRRFNDAPAQAPVKPVVKVAQVPRAIAAAAKIPVLPAVTPVTHPQTSVPMHTTGISAPSTVAHAIAPRVVSKPSGSDVTAIANIIHPVLGEIASIKALAYGAPVATGSQMLLPTGKRIVMPKTPAKVAQLPAVKPAAVLATRVRAVKAIAVVATPKPVTTKALAAWTMDDIAPIAVSKPAMPSVAIVQAKPVVKAAKPAQITPVATKPTVQVAKPIIAKSTVQVAQPTAPKPVVVAIAKPKLTVSHPRIVSAAHSVAAASLIRIGHGARMPNVGTFPIVMDSKMVEFDDVKPRVQSGVPLTPFRHLFEQSGGKVGWEHATKTVTANGRNREIYIKIGDKLAKVNNFPIEMDLAPFIDRGRTIIPISFLQDCLGVQVDYDPVTGHVLITSTKKK